MLASLAAGAASGVMLRSTGRQLRVPWATIATTAAVAAMFVAQTAWPPLLSALARTRGLLECGEIWRAVTALFVQDGGLAGALFNLTILLVVGSIAELRLGTRRWLIAYFGGGIATEFLALAWQPNGAGNSIACFALAGALSVSFRRGKGMALRSIAAAIALSASLMLLLLHDIHGIGFFAGAAIGGILAWQDGGHRNL
jgi:membrane associated rhomboid family serine protease